MPERIYFTINESLARSAKHMMSFDDYVEGSKTASYKKQVDEVYDLAERVSKEKPREEARAWRIAQSFARRLADNMNANSRISCMCPSVMISGASNFPVKKKEKQNAAWDRNMQEWNEIQQLPKKLHSILSGKEVIRADDEDAVLRLEEKLSSLQAEQERMKAANEYFRKNKTLEGCPEVTPEEIAAIKSIQARTGRTGDAPFAPYHIQNNNANIRATKQRLEKLKKEKAKESSEVEHEDIGVTVVENVEAMRLQMFFPGKPEPDIVNSLKHHAFKWSPKNGCWQRQLTDNARWAAKEVLKLCREKDGMQTQE